LSFVFLRLRTCPHEMECENCEYYEEREVTSWYKYKMKALKGIN